MQLFEHQVVPFICVASGLAVTTKRRPLFFIIVAGATPVAAFSIQTVRLPF